MSAIQNVISDLESHAGIRQTDIATITDVSKATISRWRSGKSQPAPDKEVILADLRYVAMRLRDYYEPDEIRIWLNSPHPQLNGARAIDCINRGQRIKVMEIIGRLDGDAYL